MKLSAIGLAVVLLASADALAQSPLEVRQAQLQVLADSLLGDSVPRSTAFVLLLNRPGANSADFASEARELVKGAIQIRSTTELVDWAKTDIAAKFGAQGLVVRQLLSGGALSAGGPLQGYSPELFRKIKDLQAADLSAFSLISREFATLPEATSMVSEGLGKAVGSSASTVKSLADHFLAGTLNGAELRNLRHRVEANLLEAAKQMPTSSGDLRMAHDWQKIGAYTAAIGMLTGDKNVQTVGMAVQSTAMIFAAVSTGGAAAIPMLIGGTQGLIALGTGEAGAGTMVSTLLRELLPALQAINQSIQDVRSEVQYLREDVAQLIRSVERLEGTIRDARTELAAVGQEILTSRTYVDYAFATSFKLQIGESIWGCRDSTIAEFARDLFPFRKCMESLTETALITSEASFQDQPTTRAQASQNLATAFRSWPKNPRVEELRWLKNLFVLAAHDSSSAVFEPVYNPTFLAIAALEYAEFVERHMSLVKVHRREPSLREIERLLAAVNSADALLRLTQGRLSDRKSSQDVPYVIANYDAKVRALIAEIARRREEYGAKALAGAALRDNARDADRHSLTLRPCHGSSIPPSKRQERLLEREWRLGDDNVEALQLRQIAWGAGGSDGNLLMKNFPIKLCFADLEVTPVRGTAVYDIPCGIDYARYAVVARLKVKIDGKQVGSDIVIDDKNLRIPRWAVEPGVNYVGDNKIDLLSTAYFIVGSHGCGGGSAPESLANSVLERLKAAKAEIGQGMIEAVSKNYLAFAAPSTEPIGFAMRDHTPLSTLIKTPDPTFSSLIDEVDVAAAQVRAYATLIREQQRSQSTEMDSLTSSVSREGLVDSAFLLAWAGCAQRIVVKDGEWARRLVWDTQYCSPQTIDLINKLDAWTGNLESLLRKKLEATNAAFAQGVGASRTGKYAMALDLVRSKLIEMQRQLEVN